MRWRGIEIAGAAAVVGVLALIVLAFWPQTDSSQDVVAGTAGESVLGPTEASPGSSPEPTPKPDKAPDDNADQADSPRPGISPERRAQIRVQVLNAGAEDGAAALATGALAEQSFQPLEPADAAEESSGTRVLFAENRRPAALTVGRIVGAAAADVVRAPRDDPNWAEFGTDLDVLVIVGPPLP